MTAVIKYKVYLVPYLPKNYLSLLVSCRAIPRIKAISKDIPVAAERKFCDRQCQHLRQITHRGFSAISLPIGIGGKACWQY